MKNKKNKLDGAVLNTEDFNGDFNLPKKTGRLMFGFDDDEPQECGIIYNYGNATLELQQQKDSDNIPQKIASSIEFTSKDGKKFRLFIENCN